jgi:hypothetical protein
MEHIDDILKIKRDSKRNFIVVNVEQRKLKLSNIKLPRDQDDHCINFPTRWRTLPLGTGNYKSRN